MSINQTVVNINTQVRPIAQMSHQQAWELESKRRCRISQTLTVIRNADVR